MSGRRGSGGKRSGGGPRRGAPGTRYVKKGNQRYDRHDHYFKKARSEGYLARSVYKLEELDKDFKLIRPGDMVLDLGSAPGSWLQYAERRVSAKGGKLVGIDLLPVRMSFGPHVHIIEGDVFEATVEELMPPGVELEEGAEVPRPFDVVMSDMMANTTGVKAVDQARSMALAERALDLCERVLRPGGRFCVKVFEGPDFHDYIKALRATFEQVKIRRPKGVRVGSIETYVVALAKRQPRADLGAEHPEDDEDEGFDPLAPRDET
jgi:23S rRNA (uridine2552-2'-O)-methyltransferase